MSVQDDALFMFNRAQAHQDGTFDPPDPYGVPFPPVPTATANVEFVVKDSGQRQQYDSGMVRDIEEGKTDYSNVLHGPMFDRWAEHLTKAKAKYPDVAPGVPNWTLAEGPEELARYRRSAFRHLVKWLKGQVDEDHAAAVFFNINGAEYVLERMTQEDPF